MISRRTLLGAGAGLTAAVGGLLPSGTAGARSAAARHQAKWDTLRTSLTGDLVLPDDAAYDAVRKLPNAQFDAIRPRAVAMCETPRDVSTCVRFAQDHALETAVRSGGHNYAGWSTSEGLVINLTRLDHVVPGPGRVRLGPGVQAVDVLPALRPHGLNVPAGFCPTVCPGGFFTGGGTGWQYRKYGPASDRLLSARVVLADGRIVTASEDRHPDLFWALRGGGGGNFGVVTDFTVASTSIRRVGHYVLTWSWDQARSAVPGYLEWAARGSADLACSGTLRMADARPGAVPVFVVSGVHFGSTAELDSELRALVGLVGGQPQTRAVEELPYEQAMMRVFGCEGRSTEACHTVGDNPEAILPRTAYVKNRGRMFDRVMPQAGVDAMLTAFDAERRAGQFRMISLLGLGKNANLPATGSTAWVHRDALNSCIATVTLDDSRLGEEDRQAAEHWLDGVFRAVDPYSNGRSYVNFPDLDLPDWADAYYGSNLPGLRRVKRRYDPHGFFRFAQSIPVG
ncbi:FAD-binding oxidoreductase [Streptomyces alkaliterrae]|uniref:FAD-binding oxidoreductase n=1 Tax=Streptomyces alkaliterrae TaxID=2213162 RepID=A0A5P0YN72_9ACTN|nr:FAD-binding oxidoreductase [Streptomyces alkaliterrae]MBB1256061.1 FAD-binding oxidoreductase [Streptomyces alkaliterrae]MBB1257759.1 FAD-binding oxidoreductase [Streptomyces alkaliterrae]MQS01370.1 FAD-binding protein [Streptomyces alkaliterrae]